ncbi:MAG: insulinase family protein [Bacteroidetes bacterium]|jgi:zinc protease|nr:insulinase family protein [Bacteroidota bacterium]MBT6684919.1 insulinase family protein [Bacteroidota bacterium]MBT7145224.1 insulinase family protein [Bacteroidota bacterium]MBT7492995.1 insulinase family protein [Bacteroidota bacterium]
MKLNRKKQVPIATNNKINFIKPDRITLDNNIPLYAFNAGIQDVIKIDFIFNAGVWYQEKNLVSSATISMLNEGTKNLSSFQIAEKLDYYGAYLTYNVEHDKAIVTLYSLSKYMEETLNIFADIILNPIFPANEFEIYLKKRKQSFIVENSKAKSLAHKKFQEVIFSENCPYGRKTVVEDFDNLELQQIREFYGQHYNSKNCDIIISGKFDKNILSLLNKLFGQSSWDKTVMPVEKNVSINSSLEKKHFVLKENSIQSAIRIGKLCINEQHIDFQSMKILNVLFGGYFGSRLMKNIREEKGYTYGIGSVLVPLQNSGFFVIVAETATEYCKKAVNEIYFEIEKLKQDLVKPNELDTVKNYILGDLMRNFDGAFALADSYRLILDFKLNSNYYEKYVEQIKSITPLELNKIATKYLVADKMYEVIVGNRY